MRGKRQQANFFYLLCTFCSLVSGFWFLLYIFCLSGCGYTCRPLIVTGSRTIFISPFKNSIDIAKEASSRERFKAYKPFVEVKLTDAVTDRFIFDGNLKVTDAQRADLLLEGELVDYIRQPVKYSDSWEVLEYRLNIVVNFSLKDTRQDKVILDQKSLTADTTYFVTGKSAKTEDEAVGALLEDLARRVVNRVVHQW